ncbi:MAG: hypothetical protein OXC63_12880 [Aestuariivita sp.]|nr:hypothetical protein [Aestuariivita sp.]
MSLHFATHPDLVRAKVCDIIVTKTREAQIPMNRSSRGVARG